MVVTRDESLWGETFYPRMLADIGMFNHRNTTAKSPLKFP